VKVSLRFRFAFATLLLVALGAVAQKPAQKSPDTASKPSTSKDAATTENAEGEKRFQAQCSRCHLPPEDLSPREAKAVVRQMRVRANLSAEDERLILKYLAP
jgi:cytochrome c5